VLFLGIGDCFIQFPEDGVDVEDSDSGVVVNEEFRGQYGDILIVVFALVFYERSQEEVGCGVGLPWDVFDLEPVIL